MAVAIVRLGLVGSGRWGRNYIRTIGSIDGVVLVGVASGNPATVDFVPAHTCVVKDWRTLVARPDVDGIVVATPPAAHAEILSAAVCAGKAVLVEKPLVTAREALTAIAEVCARSPQTVMVDHTHLFHPAFRTLKTQAGKIGPPRAIRSSAGAKGPYRRDVPVLWDWAPHDVAMALDLVPGAADVVDAVTLARREIDGVTAERLRLGLRLAHGVDCRITLSTLDEKHRWFALDFDDRTLMYSDQNGPPLRIFPKPGAQVDEEGMALAVPPGLPLTIAVREFAEAIRDGKRMRDNFTLACQVVDVIADCEAKMSQAPSSGA